MNLPLVWRHGDRAYVRGRYVRVLAFHGRRAEAVLVRPEDAPDVRLLVLVRELQLAPFAPARSA